MPVQLLSGAARDGPGAYPGLELLATAVLLLDADLNVCYANPAAENLFEVSIRQLLGNSVRALFGDAPALLQASHWFDWLGSDDGGMPVVLTSRARGDDACTALA